MKQKIEKLNKVELQYIAQLLREDIRQYKSQEMPFLNNLLKKVEKQKDMLIYSGE